MSILDIKDFAFHRHDVVCNQKYDNIYPYSIHLNSVANFAKRFSYLLKNEEEIYDALAGAYLHDTIEDARLTYNDIKQKFGEEIAEIVWACTESAGRTREERKDAAFFSRLKSNRLGVYVKLCDLMANSLYSEFSGNKGFIKSRKQEWDKYCAELEDYQDEFKEMFDYLDNVYTL